MRFGKRKKRRRLDAPEALEEVLERVGEHRFAKKQLPIPLAQWRAAVGPRIADRARPIALERGVLIVKVATSVWANELSMLAPQIITKLAQPSAKGAAGIEVKALRFRVGPLDVIEGIPQARDYRKVPPPAPLAPELQTSLAKVEDEDLRGAIERAARASMAWQMMAPKKVRPSEMINAGPRGAPAPRDAGRGSAPPGRSAEDSDEASPRSSGGGSGRRP
jgi:hypothetical protein